MSTVCVVPSQVEIGRSFAYIGIGEGTATWAVTNLGYMICSCLCSCCYRGQLCGCIVGLIMLVIGIIGIGGFVRGGRN